MGRGVRILVAVVVALFVLLAIWARKTPPDRQAKPSVTPARKAKSTPQPKPKKATEPQLPLPDLAPLDKEAILRAELRGEDKKRPFVVGETNLPNGTKLYVEIEGSAGWSRSNDVVVSRGRFKTEAYGGTKGLPSDNFVLRVVMYAPNVQPKSVLAVIGDEGENLKGKLAKTITGSTVEDFEKRFRIGGKKEAAAALKAQLKEAKRIYSEIKRLEKSGSGKMRRLSRSSDPHKNRECIVLLEKHQATAKQLEEAARKLPGTKYFDLQLAASHVVGCVTCMESYSKRGCADTRAALKEQKNSQKSRK